MDDFPHSKFPSFLLPAGWVIAEHPVDCKKPAPIIPKGSFVGHLAHIKMSPEKVH